ncbi:MAG: VIT domain-containing protein [Planctomycetota bacterium]|jgi:hypothetical protein
MKRSVMAAAFLLLLSCTAAVAGDVPPALVVKVGEKHEQLGVTALKVDARILGFLAETRMTMTFRNPHGRQLEGDLYFPLPEGSTVSGYALDINGKMVDGVIVEKHKGRQVFEKIVRRNIDPGLVEWTKGNNFKTRVFPIPAGGTRTVMVRYVSELEAREADGVYRLPMAFGKKIPEVSLRVEVLRPVHEPVLDDACQLEGLRFVRFEKGFVAEKKAEDVAPRGALVVRVPGGREPTVVLEKDPDGTVHFCVGHFPADPRARAGRPRLPRRVTVLWDCSGSRGSAGHEREFALIRALFAPGGLGAGPVEVKLVPFSNAAQPAKNFRVAGGNVDRLLEALRAIKYDGGTQLACVRPADGAARPDVYLLFTDGISTFGRSDPGTLPAPVYAFASAAGADAPALKRLAARSGGQYFNLSRTEDAEVVEGMGREPYSFLSATAAEGGAGEVFPTFSEPVAGRFALAGRLTAGEALLTVRFGHGGRVCETKQVRLRAADAVAGDLLRRYWAQKKLAELLLDPGRNREAMVELGRKCGIVTPHTSLIVLDNPAQYVEHRIRPPGSMPEWVKVYDAAMAKLAAREKKAEQDKIGRVLAMWHERVRWWKTDFAEGRKAKVLEALGRRCGDPEAFRRDLAEAVPDIAGAKDLREKGGRLTVVRADGSRKTYDISGLLAKVRADRARRTAIKAVLDEVARSAGDTETFRRWLAKMIPDLEKARSVKEKDGQLTVVGADGEEKTYQIGELIEDVRTAFLKKIAWEHAKQARARAAQLLRAAGAKSVKEEEGKLVAVMADGKTRTVDPARFVNEHNLKEIASRANNPETFKAEIEKRVVGLAAARSIVEVNGKLVVVHASGVQRIYDVQDLLKQIQNFPGPQLGLAVAPPPPAQIVEGQPDQLRRLREAAAASRLGQRQRMTDMRQLQSLQRSEQREVTELRERETVLLRRTQALRSMENARLDRMKSADDEGREAPAPAIDVKAWDPKTPYLAALKAAGEGQVEGIYMAQRVQFGKSPAFFLDCADFLLRKGERDLAVRVLSNIAELELESAMLLRILGHRLAQIGELDLSVLVFEEVKRLRPEEPQSWRDLALVLEQRADLAARGEKPAGAAADYARAMKLLAHVVMNQWDRFEQIELIALMELNAMVPRARAAGAGRPPLDERLVALLDVDVRIILTWDADLTDIDLWVTEPTGEKVFYSHTRSTIGANFSRDFTQGYGPEEYLLRQAVGGTYRIQAQFYGSSARKLTGAVTLQLEIFTGYGRPDQKRKSITLRLKDQKEVVDVGRITF